MIDESNSDVERQLFMAECHLAQMHHDQSVIDNLAVMSAAASTIGAFAQIQISPFIALIALAVVACIASARQKKRVNAASLRVWELEESLAGFGEDDSEDKPDLNG